MKRDEVSPHMRELLFRVQLHDIGRLPFPPHRLSFRRLRRAAARIVGRCP